MQLRLLGAIAAHSNRCCFLQMARVRRGLQSTEQMYTQASPGLGPPLTQQAQQLCNASALAPALSSSTCCFRASKCKLWFLSFERR